MGSITDAEVGQEVATDGILGKLVLSAVPTEYGNDYFCLTDGDGGPTLFNMHVQSSPVSAGSVLIDKGTVAFKSLFVKSIPPGCALDYELGSAPTVSSLEPNTAVAETDPDFELKVIGTGFFPGTVIYFGAGIDQDEPTTWVSDTEVSTIVKPSLFFPDTVPVSVRYGPLKSEPVDFIFTAPPEKETTPPEEGTTSPEETE